MVIRESAEDRNERLSNEMKAKIQTVLCDFIVESITYANRIENDGRSIKIVIKGKYKKRWKYIFLTAEIMADLLKLPEKTKIVKTSMHMEKEGLCIVLEHESFPILVNEQNIPKLEITTNGTIN